MYSDDDIKAAVDAQVLTPEQYQQLRTFLQHQRASAALPDEEHFRLLSGFNDIFVVVAAILALGATWTLGGLLAPWLGGLLVAAFAWGLAEYFTRIKRMALPSIVLLVFCVGATFLGTVMTLEQFFPNQAYAPLTAFALSSLVAYAHWQRFQVPITIAAATATITGVCISFLTIFIPFSEQILKIGFFSAGIIVFILALRWDHGDIKRETRRSDVAFWLHLLAAPLIVHPIFSTLANADSGLQQAIITIALYLCLASVSLIIDRRALMVSALAYVVYVFSKLLDSYGFMDGSTAVIGVIIGSGLLLVAVYWHPLRGKLIRRLPKSIQQAVPTSH
ncbi:hypothetical protein [Pseudidiomarina taiwanensis]|uniref:DUF2157 domain-containing protein n=1 Tax=Pseudidiomarina taiwanensis TaxID=337250 RepID=A0A432ZCU3_9GAMM|nr:hypothetical protein [Pseudidiomarina taiwanensis]RUO75719.1 hypothetical protein CWI83_10120 [Pseudidiomarina taiwanensis]